MTLTVDLHVVAVIGVAQICNANRTYLVEQRFLARRRIVGATMHSFSLPCCANGLSIRLEEAAIWLVSLLPNHISLQS